MLLLKQRRTWKKNIADQLVCGDEVLKQTRDGDFVVFLSSLKLEGKSSNPGEAFEYSDSWIVGRGAPKESSST